MDQSGYRLAVQICNATADKLQRNVCQYFTDIVVAHSQEEEFEEIRSAHALIKQLNRACPSLLHSVLPQLEEELRADDVQLRQIVTQVLGDMFSDKGGPDLVKKYPSTWNVWLNRRNDKSAAVRLKFVESARGLLASLPDQQEIVEGGNVPYFIFCHCQPYVSRCVEHQNAGSRRKGQGGSVQDILTNGL